MDVITINGKPLQDCSDEELSSEWNAGMALESQVDVWTKEQDERLSAVEREINRRFKAGTWTIGGDDE